MRFEVGDEVRDTLGREGRVTTAGVNAPGDEVIVRLDAGGILLYYGENQLSRMAHRTVFYKAPSAGMSAAAKAFVGSFLAA